MVTKKRCERKKERHSWDTAASPIGWVPSFYIPCSFARRLLHSTNSTLPGWVQHALHSVQIGTNPVMGKRGQKSACWKEIEVCFKCSLEGSLCSFGTPRSFQFLFGLGDSVCWCTVGQWSLQCKHRYSMKEMCLCLLEHLYYSASAFEASRPFLVCMCFNSNLHTSCKLWTPTVSF